MPYPSNNSGSEIVLRSAQFCNLTEQVVRPDDTIETLLEKAEIATILGTLQATLTDFRYLSKEWKHNTEEEALLGVSMTGIMDHPLLNTNSEELKNILEILQQRVTDVNIEWSKKLDINQATATTAIKPSGTVSQLVDSASGIHARFAPYYIRTVRADSKDPLAKMMIDQGVPYEPDVTKPESTYVFSFPMKAPEGSVFKNDRTAIEQLELWKLYQLHWCSHKPSITVYVKEDEWLEIGAWVYKNFDYMSGVSFLPHSDHIYKQAPYQEITEEQYIELNAKMPVIDWARLGEYESEDHTVSQQTLACVGGACEIL
jgi:ribonucleoside-triphosphate reductase